MKSKNMMICLILAFLIVWVVHYPPIRQTLSAVKYSLDSGDTITDVNNPTFTGTVQVGKSGTAGYLYLYKTDTAGGTSEGTLYMDDSENLLKYYNGSSWLTVGIDYDQQSLIDYDDYKDTSGITGEETGEEATWTETSGNMDSDCMDANDVCRDERTGLYWSDKYSSTKQNNFTLALCSFFSQSDRGVYAGDDTDCGATGDDATEEAINYCATLSLDSDNDATPETDWYLPSQKELMQAYIDGSENNIVNAYPGSPFYYWSSTEQSTTNILAWFVWLGLGYTNYTSKTTSYWVRCVRRD